MKTLNLKGIILGNLDYKETSKIVYIFTKYGKISVKAIGSKNKKSKMLSFITTLNEVSFEISDTEFPTLIDYNLISANNHLKQDLKSNLWFMYLIQILNKLPNSYSEKTYLFLMRIIEHSKTIDVSILVVLFQVKMLFVFGVKPQFDKCIYTSTTSDLVFDIENGGSVSKKYASSDTYDYKYLQQIKILYNFNDTLDDFVLLKGLDYKILVEILKKYYNRHVNIYLKGSEYLIYN